MIFKMKYHFILLFTLFADSSQHCRNIYQVFLGSFKDSNGDGIGDLQGLASKADHFVDLQMDCISITPCFKSGLYTAGYDIIDYTKIGSQYGTIKDFDNLMHVFKRKGLKLIIDLVINHSSDQHRWFQLSINRIPPYTDYYVWADPKGYDENGNPIPPNNWLSIIKGSAWTWNNNRKQFYLHQFVDNQPDLNLTNPHVQKDIEKIIKFWLDKGVRGIRLDAAQHFVEDAQFRDEPQNNPDQKNITWEDLIHIYTTHLPETYNVIGKIRDFTQKYANKYDLGDIIILSECASGNMTEIMKYFSVTIPYNFQLMNLKEWLNAKQLKNYISQWINSLPPGATSNWMSENHDEKRISSRFCDEYSGIITILITVLPGIAIFYYGQEIGMKNLYTPSTPNDISQRLPMQWDSSINAGFSMKRELTVPVNTDYWKSNIELQKREKSSYYHMFKTLMHLRNKKTLRKGSLKMYVISTWIFAVVRKDFSISYVTVVNLGTNTEIVNLSSSIEEITKLKVEVGTVNSGYKNGYKIDPSTIFLLRPTSGLILSWKN